MTSASPHTTFTFPSCVPLSQYATTAEQRAVLSHWIQLVRFRFSLPYDNEARQMLPPDLCGQLARDWMNDGDPLQRLFPDVLEAPFRPISEPTFRFVDLFAGIGGFRLAMQHIGGVCVFSSEWNVAAQKTYFDNFGELPFGDITSEYTKSRIPRSFDVLCAGFPCQPFSLAGVSARTALNRETGFQDKTQGTLFFDVLTILRRHRPKVVFLENVKNLVNHDKGRTFKIIRDSIQECGYSFHWKIMDASHLVPQKRLRCYMVCIRDNGDFTFPDITGQELPLKSILEPHPDPSYTISDALWEGHQKRTKRNLERGAGFTAFTADLNKPAHTLVARYYKDGKECLIPQPGENPRLLTKRECARLQGFPENFRLPESRTETYRQMGNSVAVPVLMRIAECIRDQCIQVD